ncbi:MAG: hypothetical protein M3Q19_13145 [Pseudomonadota bacterium]|nr:hypothetical protein [Pseudomonadota bacterium]
MLADALAALEELPAIVELRESYLVYPLVNTVHIVGIALLFGAIVPLDLRLAGWRREAASLDGLSRLLLPVAIFGFLLAAAAGLLLFATDARAYAASPLFQAKLLLIALALANALALRRVDWRSAGPSMRVAFAGAASVTLWLGVILLGRLIGYLE